MKPNDRTFITASLKVLAKPLSTIVAHPSLIEYSRLFEMYWNVLLGKGAGSGWAREAEVVAALSTIQNTAPIIFDVGANIGLWSEQFYRACPRAQIFLFEPQPACQKIIRERNIPQSILIPNAVSATTGERLTMFAGKTADATASLHARRDSYFSADKKQTFEVQSVSIDSIVQDYALTQIDFMKMDVEGHEIEVLKGAIESMQKGLIKAFSFEFGSGNINSRTYFHDFWDLLTPLGYKIYRILPSSKTLLIKEYYEDCEYFRGATNYLAVLAV